MPACSTGPINVKVHIQFERVYPTELGKERAAHSSTVAWKIPWTEEPCRLQSMGVTKSNFTFTFTLLNRWSKVESVIEKQNLGDFTGGSVVRNLPSNAGDTGSVPGWGTKSHVPLGN